jgi:hypothetical protein
LGGSSEAPSEENLLGKISHHLLSDPLQGEQQAVASLVAVELFPVPRQDQGSAQPSPLSQHRKKAEHLLNGVLVLLGPAAKLGHDDVVAARGGVLRRRFLAWGLPAGLRRSTQGLCKNTLLEVGGLLQAHYRAVMIQIGVFRHRQGKNAEITQGPSKGKVGRAGTVTHACMVVNMT